MSVNCKSKGKYHGLINHGRTCYLNCGLQVLFMTREFREAVNSFVDDNPDTDCIDSQLKELFDQLLKKQTDPHKLLKALHIDKVFEQQDAAEYLERILRRTTSKAANIFLGQMAHRTSCSVCGTATDTDGPFWHLPLELVNSCSGHYSVENGIEDFFKPSNFTGENQMHCDECNTKVHSTSEYVVKKHPDVLILLLKRFDFSQQSMLYVKVTCDVDVPYTLKIPQNCTYELYAAVLHSGDLRGGHYRAVIKPPDDDRWFSFDDKRVTQLYEGLFSNKNIANGAHLLFYRKKDSGPEDSKDEHPNEDHPATKDAGLKPADTDKERSTNVKAKRKGCCFHGDQVSVTAGESKQKKPKDNLRPDGGNSSRNKNSWKEKEKNINKRDKNQDLDRSELDHQHPQSSLFTESGCDEGVADQERRNIEQNVSGTYKTQKDALKRDCKNKKNDEGPDGSHRRSAPERGARRAGHQTAERRNENKEMFRANSSQELQRAADRGRSSEQSRSGVEKITSETTIYSKTINKPLIVKTLETAEVISDRNTGKVEGNNHKTGRNAPKVSLPTRSGMDHRRPLQSGISSLKIFPGLELDTSDSKQTQKTKRSTFL